jgi:hypothetical protein
MAKRKAKKVPVDKKRATTRLIVGRKGSGKSFLGKKIANEAKGRIVVWDAVGEWAEDKALKRAASFRSLVEYYAHIAQGGEQPERMTLGASRGHWPTFLAYCYLSIKTSGGGLVVIEELDAYTSSSDSSEEWNAMVNRSRHAGIDLLCICPRIMSVPVGIRQQADSWLVFKSEDPDVLKEVKRQFGAEAEEIVRNLKLYEHHEFTR